MAVTVRDYLSLICSDQPIDRDVMPLIIRIRVYMTMHSLTAVWLAKKVGIVERTLWLILEGRKPLPVELYMDICRAFGVPFGFFLDDGGWRRDISDFCLE